MSFINPGSPCSGMAQKGHIEWKPLVPCGMSTFDQYLSQRKQERQNLNESSSKSFKQTYLAVDSETMCPQGLKHKLGNSLLVRNAGSMPISNLVMGPDLKHIGHVL